MVAKTTTTKTASAARKTTTAAAKKTTTATTKKAVASPIIIDVMNVGFKAGDVYQALAAADGTALTVAEIAKAAKIAEEEVYLGIGWLLKEGKIVANGEKVALA